MYKKLKAEKLVKEFDYLKTKSYYPLGPEGREYKITDLEIQLPDLEISILMKEVHKRKNPNYKEQMDKEHHDGANWKVLVIISDNKDMIKIELEKVLKVLKIRHDIDKIFND